MRLPSMPLGVDFLLSKLLVFIASPAQIELLQGVRGGVSKELLQAIMPLTPIVLCLKFQHFS